MAYDEALAHRVREVLSDEGDWKEIRMFGGLAFMVNGHMCCGVTTEDLMVRVGKERHQEALALPHARPMDFTGRPLAGMVYVGGEGVRTEGALRKWVRMGVRFTATLPPKKKKPKPAKKKAAAKM